MNKWLMVFVVILGFFSMLTSCVSTSKEVAKETSNDAENEALKERLKEAYKDLIVEEESADPALVWDFEDGNDHGFILKGIKEGELPKGGSAWSIGPPDQYDGQIPVVKEGCHINPDGTLIYNNGCNQPFEYPKNIRGQKSYLNTYNLSQWGDSLHIAENDQIAKSPNILLGENAKLSVWSLGGSTSYVKPALDADPAEGYIKNSCGLAVLSADDNSMLASVFTPSQGGLQKYTISLAEFAGKKIYVEVVDSFAGSWGWIAVDEIQITNSEVIRE